MQLSELQTRVRERLGDPTGAYYDAAGDVIAALNVAQRLFALATLCLETTREFEFTPGVTFYRMLREWADWIAPLRVRLSSDTTAGNDAEFDAQKADNAMFNEQAYAGLVAPVKPKLLPVRLSDLSALDDNWGATTGPPTNYGCLGFDLFFPYPTPVISGTQALITYARSPVALANPKDVPEIPDPDHNALVDGAVALVRLREGGQEFRQAVAGPFAAYLGAIQQRARAVRTRSLAQRLDKLPLELEKTDLSKLMRLRADLVPGRKETAWPITT